MKPAARAVAATAAIGALGIAATLRRRKRNRDVTEDRAGVARSLTVRRGAADLYEMWRSPSALPGFVRGLRSVEVVDERNERWTFAFGDGLWVLAVKVIETSNAERIGWEFFADETLRAQAAVSFAEAPANRGTEVRLSIAVTVPGAKLVSSIGRPFGISPGQIAMESLRQFKSLVEAGEVPRAVRT